MVHASGTHDSNAVGEIEVVINPTGTSAVRLAWYIEDTALDRLSPTVRSKVQRSENCHAASTGSWAIWAETVYVDVILPTAGTGERATVV